MTNGDKTILYDDACPLCATYTAGFVRAGMLDASGRKTFAQTGAAERACIDLDRARHEIPLIDRAGGETRYGLDALFTLLAARFPALTPVFRAPVLRATLVPLYRYISYNRRQIAGCQVRPTANGFDAAPDFHRTWRVRHLCLCAALWAFLAFASAAGCVAAVALAVAGFACVQAVGIARAVFALPSRSGAWDRAGSLATNAATFALLFALALAALRSFGAAGQTVALAFAAFVTLADANRRLCGSVPCETAVRVD